MPACKVGCCPDNICECSNDCECLLPDDPRLSPGYYRPSFLIEDLKGVVDGSRHNICPCRTKEELVEYVKPIEPHLHENEGHESSKDNDSGGKNRVSSPESCTEECANPPGNVVHCDKISSEGNSSGGEQNVLKPTGDSCYDDVSCEERKSNQGKQEHSDTCSVNEASKTEQKKPSSYGESETCAGNISTSEPSHSPTTYSDDKSYEDRTPTHQAHNQCWDDRIGKSPINSWFGSFKELPRTNSLPTKPGSPTSRPNTPTKIAKAPNFEIKSNFSFDVSPVPYRKVRRSQSLAEARLGNLLNERRPSCFQRSAYELREGLVPDPHRGHYHHHVHEYHHAKHDHHHNHDNHGQHDNHGHHEHGNDSCYQHDFHDDCKCEDLSPSATQEWRPLMNRKESKIDVDELIVRTTKLRVQNLCCPKEGQIVHDELRKLEGIADIRINVIGRVVHVSHFAKVVSPTTLMKTLNKRHLGASIVDTGSKTGNEKGLPRALKIRLINVAIQSLFIAVALGGMFSSTSWYMWIAITEIAFGILPILKKVCRAIRNLEIDLNILITVTVIGTLVIQEWIEGAAVVFVFTLAGFLQRYCFYRVQKTISSLMLSKPSKAVMACTGECIPVEDVPIGSIIAVRQGELIPLDGIVVKGVASVDESSISGEATPVEKIFECPAYSGTVIQTGYLEIETTSSSTSSTISKISSMVEEAQMNVSPTELMVNKFAKFYTPLVIVVAALVFLIPLFIGLSGVESIDGRAKTWGERALIVLVTACPCALLMATPVVVICGITGAARLGALIKGGTFLEALGQLNLLAFDKTGTLTEGKFQVVDLVPADRYDESDVLRWAAALESKSSHPLAAAVVNEFTGECVSDFVAQSDVLPDVSDFCTLEGQGISGKVEGHDIQVGNRSLLEKNGVSLTSKFETAYISFCTDAKTVIFVCVDGKLALMISLADIIRWESRPALSWLQDLGVHLCMLTGDAKQTADAVQKELQLDSCVSDMKPDDKLNWITDVTEGSVRQRRCGWLRKKRRQIVGMVGDGVNDGPALAASDVGIAMAAGGSALAVEAAGVALMNNSVLKVPEIICLSRFCRRIILENIILSVLLKLVFVTVALTGFVRVWMAVLADIVGLLAVILNGLRPLKWKPPRSKTNSAKPRASFNRKRPLLMFETVV